MEAKGKPARTPHLPSFLLFLNRVHPVHRRLAAITHLRHIHPGGCGSAPRPCPRGLRQEKQPYATDETRFARPPFARSTRSALLRSFRFASGRASFFHAIPPNSTSGHFTPPGWLHQMGRGVGGNRWRPAVAQISESAVSSAFQPAEVGNTPAEGHPIIREIRWLTRKGVGHGAQGKWKVIPDWGFQTPDSATPVGL